MWGVAEVVADALVLHGHPASVQGLYGAVPLLNVPLRSFPVVQRACQIPPTRASASPMLPASPSQRHHWTLAPFEVKKELTKDGVLE